MNESQANKAVFICAAVLLASTFLQHAYGVGKSVKKGSAKDLGKTELVNFKRFFMIGLLILVLAMTADFVPEVAGPLALLILISVAIHDSKYYGKVFQ